MKSKLWWMLFIVVAPCYAVENSAAATPPGSESADLALPPTAFPRELRAKLIAWGQAVDLPYGKKRPPANSLELVKCAADLGFDAIELDIRVSRDGVPVLAHDDLLPGDVGRITGHSFSALKQMQIGEWRGKTVRIASLEEALALERRPKVIVADMRVKASHGEAVAEVVRRNMDAADFIFTAYNVSSGQAFHLALPRSRVFLKTYDTPDIEWIDSAADAGLSGIMFQVRDSLAVPLGHIVTAARKRGLETMTFVHVHSRHGETRLNAQSFTSWIRRHARVFFDVWTWMEFLRGFDFVVGTRIHGVLMGIQVGVPGICVVSDSRTRELCETMDIPHVLSRDHRDGLDRVELMGLFREQFDAGRFDSKRRRLAANYLTFLEGNGLTVKGSLRSLARAA